MQFQQDYLDHPIHIKSYNTNPDNNNPEITIIDNINNQELKITNNLLVLLDEIKQDWRPNIYNDIKTSDINALIELNPEIIILGIGDKLVQLEHAVLEPLYTAQVPFEVMTTINACRTYNLLASEHRKILVALIL